MRLNDGVLIASYDASLIQFRSASAIQVSINSVCEISWDTVSLGVS